MTRFAFTRAALTLVAATALATPRAHAILGETMDQLKTRLGKPQRTENKGVGLWFFEAVDGVLSYTVTFDAEGRSIAEGVRPMKRARFTPEAARDFIATQTHAIADSKTLRTVNSGEKYQFTGRDFICKENEQVIVDDPHGLLIIWTKAPIPSIMAISRAMMARMTPAPAPASAK